MTPELAGYLGNIALSWSGRYTRPTFRAQNYLTFFPYSTLHTHSSVRSHVMVLCSLLRPQMSGAYTFDDFRTPIAYLDLTETYVETLNSKVVCLR